jgi:hypothetical protein
LARDAGAIRFQPLERGSSKTVYDFAARFHASFMKGGRADCSTPPVSYAVRLGMAKLKIRR